MARLVTSSATPVLVFVIQTFLEDGSIVEKEFREGDMIENLRYIEDKKIKTVTGRLSKINYRVKMVKHTYSSVATAKSYFSEDVTPVSIEVDCSEKYMSNVVNIPSSEIIEDDGVLNASKVRCYLKYGVRFTSSLTNMDENDFTFMEGQDIQGLVYTNNLGDTVSNVRVVAFTFNFYLNPLKMIVIENERIKQIEISVLKDMESVIPITLTNDNLDEVIAKSSGVISITGGEISKNITISKDTIIRGSYAGIRAKYRKDSPEKFKHETVFTGTITIPDGKNLYLDGVTLSKDARIVVKDADNLTVSNSIVENLTPSGKNSFVVNLPYTEKATKVVIKDCYFGPNGVDMDGNRIKNAFELTGALADGSKFSNNYFAKGVQRNNTICLYHVEDGATITVSDNIFEESINAIRVGTMGDVEAHYEFINNTYYETINGEYAGLLLIQPYGKQTISMAKNIIRISGTKNLSNDPQIWYMYYNDTDTHMTPDLVPTLIIDKTLIIENETVMAPVKNEENKS